MLFTKNSPTDKRKSFRAGLNSGKLLRMPGCFSPFIALMAQDIGFDGVYISGAGLSNELGLPDIGLTTLSEVAARGRAISRVVELPALIDIDTGFGETLNAARTIQELEEFGLSGCHLEDQENPKRCGHLDGKSLVSASAMSLKIRGAVAARKDPNFFIMARTDARTSEGLDKAIDRAKAYVDAGADGIFPEALMDEKEFETFRKAVKVPLLANMTEFGKSKLLDAGTLECLGFNIVIYPQTAFRIAMGAVEEGLKELKAKGHQNDLVATMQTRARLYEVVRYEEYNKLDQSIFNFSSKGHS